MTKHGLLTLLSEPCEAIYEFFNWRWKHWWSQVSFIYINVLIQITAEKPKLKYCVLRYGYFNGECILSLPKLDNETNGGSLLWRRRVWIYVPCNEWYSTEWIKSHYMFLEIYKAESISLHFSQNWWIKQKYLITYFSRLMNKTKVSCYIFLKIYEQNKSI